MNFCALCDVLDEEILDAWECIEKYQQLFYITFRFVVLYLKFHISEAPAGGTDRAREGVWIKVGCWREGYSIHTYITRKHKTS